MGAAEDLLASIGPSSSPVADELLKSIEKSRKAELAVNPTAADYFRSLASGAANVVTTADQALRTGGELAGIKPIEETGGALRDIGQRGEEYWQEGLTPAGREAAAGSFWRERPLSTFGMSAAQSAPGMLVMGATGAPLVTGITKATGGAVKLATSLEGLGFTPATAAKLAEWIPPAVGMGTSEGVFSAFQNAAQTGQEVAQMPIEDLRKEPGFQAELAKTDARLPLDRRETDARDNLAKIAERKVIATTIPSTSAIGMATGGGVLGQIMRPSKGVIRGALHGLASEANQEFWQSGFEQFWQNLAARSTYDHARELAKDVLDQAIVGAGAGGLLGLAGGGGHGAGGTPAPAAPPAAASGVPPSPPPVPAAAAGPPPEAGEPAPEAPPAAEEPVAPAAPAPLSEAAALRAALGRGELSDEDVKGLIYKGFAARNHDGSLQVLPLGRRRLTEIAAEERAIERAVERAVAEKAGELPAPGLGSPRAPITVESPADIQEAAARTDHKATGPMKEAENYAKARIRFPETDELSKVGSIAIETAQGHPRVAADNSWRVEAFPASYGHLEVGSVGKDGKPDVFIGEDSKADKVYVVDQVDPETGVFDETKSFLHFGSLEAAREAYVASFTDGKGEARIGAITPVDVKQWVQKAIKDELHQPIAYTGGTGAGLPEGGEHAVQVEGAAKGSVQRGAGQGNEGQGAGVGARNAGPEKPARTRGRAKTEAEARPGRGLESQAVAKVTIVRHGHTDLNDADQIRGWRDVPLNDKGREQAKVLGAALADSGITKIVTSDLSRAKDTADEVGKAVGIPVEQDMALRPWDVGTYTAKSAKESAQVLESHARDTPDEPIDGGESFNQFKTRFLTGVQKIMAANTGKHVALVTHHRGERLFNAWVKAGMPADRSIDIPEFLNWKAGIEPGTHSTFDMGGKAAVPPETQADLRRFAGRAGWAERGGRLIRNGEGASADEIAIGRGAEAGEVVGRTKWVPRATWFQAMRQDLGNRGLSDEAEIQKAAEQYIAGEKLSPKAQRTIDWMLNEIKEEREAYAAYEKVNQLKGDVTEADLLEEGFQPSGRREVIVDLMATASEIDDVATERAVIEHVEDDHGLIVALQEIINGRTPEVAEGGPAREGKAPEAGAATAPAETLTQPTPEELKARDEAAKAAEKKKAEDEAKAKADEARAGFALIGSERPADQARAAGQEELFGGSPGPDVPFMYGGERAAGKIPRLQKAVDMAKTMEARGESADRIRLTTGWSKNPHDGKWRREVSDRGAKMLLPMPAKKGTESIAGSMEESPLFGNEIPYRLQNVLAHPLLYRLYPAAKNINVVIRKGFLDFGMLQGSFDGKNTISITPYAGDPLSTLLHEVQHWIQSREGFATGGNANAVVGMLSESQKQRLAEKISAKAEDAVANAEEMVAIVKRLSVMDDQVEHWRTSSAIEDGLWAQFQRAETDADKEAVRQRWFDARNKSTKEFNALMKEALDVPTDDWFKLSENQRNIVLRIKALLFNSGVAIVRMTANAQLSDAQKALTSIRSGDPKALEDALKKSGETFNLYQAIAGEIEARDVQERQFMTGQERRATPPLASSKIAPEDVIVSVSDVEAALSNATKALAVPVIVHETAEAARTATGVDAREGDVGFYYNGKIHMIVASLPDALAAERGLWHEITHAGVDRMFTSNKPGSAYDAALTGLAAANPSVRREATAWAKLHGGELKILLAERGVSGREADDFARLRAIEEGIAKISETAKLNGLDRFIAAIQKMLRSIGLNRLADSMEGWSNAEVGDFIRQAREAAMTPQGQTVENLPAFSRAEATGNDVAIKLTRAEREYFGRVFASDADKAELLSTVPSARFDGERLTVAQDDMGKLGDYADDSVTAARGKGYRTPPSFEKATFPPRPEVPTFSRAAPMTIHERLQGVSFESAKVQWQDFVKSDRRLSRVYKVNTPFHLAEATWKDGSPIYLGFKPVYEEGQAANYTVARVANEAADLAPDLLPRVDTVKDALPEFLGGTKRNSLTRQGVEKVSDALMAGTLFGGGNPLEGRKWSDEELRTGRMTGEEGGMAGLPAGFQPLNDAEIAVYHQALASAAYSMEEHSKSMIWRLSDQKNIGLDRAMSLDEMAGTAVEEARNRVGILRDRQAETAESAKSAVGEDLTAARRELARIQRQIEELEGKTEKQEDGTQKTVEPGFIGQVQDIQNKTNALVKRGYFPAQRFGSFFVNAEDQEVGDDGKIKRTERYFARFETSAQAQIAKREVEKIYPDSVVTSGTMNTEAGKLFAGLNLDALELFADHLVDDEGKPISKDPLMQQYFRLAVQERSSLKRELHRKGIPGYSKDVPRVMSQFTTSTAASTARHYHSSKMLELVQNIRDGDLQAYATRYVKYLQDPQEESHILRSFLANYYILGSLAFGAVNMTQPVLMTAPYLTQYTSWASSMKHLGTAAMDVVRGKKAWTEDERAAYERASKEGTISPQELHQITAHGRAQMLGDSPMWQKLEAAMNAIGLPTPGKLAMRKAAFLWGSIYALTEQFNRGTTFLAAYRIAKELGEGKVGDAYHFATEATDATQVVYCVDTETEILTADGWKRHDSIHVGDAVFSIDSNGALVNDSLQAVHVFPGEREVTEFRNGNGLSMVVTDDHRNIVQNYNSRDRKWQSIRAVKTSELKQCHHILRVPLSNDIVKAEQFSDDQVRLLAWVASEGWFFAHRGSKVKRGVGITQSESHNPKYVKEIDELLERLGGHSSRFVQRNSNRPDVMVIWHLRKPLWSFVGAALPGKRVTPKFVSMLTVEQMRIFLETFTKGDGHIPEVGGVTIGQKSIETLDSLQQMAVLTGQSSTVYHRVGKHNFGALYISKNSKRAYVKEFTHERRTVDTVWCPQTAQGTWIARRNGRTFITGNSKANRPEWSRGPIGSVVMTFKQFNISYLEMAKRLYNTDKKAFGILMMHLFVLAGNAGLPFAEDVDDLIDTIGQWLGYDTNTKASLRKAVAGMVGEDLGDILLHGVSAIPGMPIDISARMGMHNIIPGSAMLKVSEPDATRDVLELLGPVGTLANNLKTAVKEIGQGNVSKASVMAPMAIQNVLKGADMWGSDEYKDFKGRKVIDTDKVDAIFKMIGLQPASVAKQTRIVGEVMQDISLSKAVETAIADKIAQGIKEDKPELREEAFEELQRWNTTNPEMTIQITPSQIRRRVQEMQMAREERLVKNAPKGMRGRVAEELMP